MKPRNFPFLGMCAALTTPAAFHTSPPSSLPGSLAAGTAYAGATAVGGTVRAQGTSAPQNVPHRHPHADVHDRSHAAPPAEPLNVRYGKSWMSKAHSVPSPGVLAATAPGDDGTTVFDLVISLYNNPSGDDDPNNDTGTEEQTAYEQIVRFWADAICEQSNEALRLGKVRIFRDGALGAIADVVWNASEWPRASVSAFGVLSKSIIFGDVFPEGCGTGCDINYLLTTRHEDAGYTLGHEFGHYVLGVYDEYVGTDPAETRIYFPQTGDTAVMPSIMNNQWAATGGNFEWLNHSTSDNYEANTAQGRVFGESAWEVLLQAVADDPKDGDRAALAQRARFTALAGNEPTAAAGWVVEELPGAQTDCRSVLEIIWMADDIELQIVIDRSDSMMGTPFSNAQQAAKTLVDEVEAGSTALGVVSFETDVNQDQPIIPIPDPPGTVRNDIKNVIDMLVTGAATSMFDGADLALDNLQGYAAANGTSAAQLVFLLSDGMDNDSTETQATVTAAYQAANVPLITFAYGTFAPEGVLREMAEDTGGLFRASPTDLAEIMSAFLSAKAALTSSAAVLQGGGTAPASGDTSFGFAVDSTLEALSIFATYDGGLGDVGFSLASPMGPVAGVGFACTEVAGATSCSAVVDAATLAAEGTGGWALIATNNTGSAIEVSVNILANPRPMRTFDLVVSSLGGTAISFPSPIVVAAAVSQGLPITGVSIAGTITDPNGVASPLMLFDNGMHGDAIASDGTYSAIVSYGMNGIHTIAVSADNGALNGEFTTSAYQPTHFRTQTSVGGFPAAGPPLPPIGENFNRSSTVQVVVSGVASDDHPDAAPGTGVIPNNADVPGEINFPADPDVFSVPTAGFSSITLRVTGLALGMDPRLRVLADDGTTEIALLEGASPGAPYVYATVPVGSNTVLHGEVRHRTGGLGIYSFSAGTRIVSDNTPPTVNCVATRTQECNTLGGADVTMTATAADLDGDDLEVRWLVAGVEVQTDSVGTVPGADTLLSLDRFFPLGVHEVTVVVSDGRAEDSCVTLLTVEDTTPPTVTVGDLVELWPSDHQHIGLDLSDCVVSIVDICEGPLDVLAVSEITSIYSDEPEDAHGEGDGHTVDDIAITGTGSFDLRVERQGGGNGRVYGITFVARDSAGNGTTATCFVGVPHDQSGPGPVDDGAGAGYTETP